MIGRLMRRERKMPIEARLDALEAAIDVKLRALLATATQAIAEVVRNELVRGRQHGGALPPVTLPHRPQHRSLLNLEATVGRVAELRQALGMRPGTSTEAEKEARR